MNENGIIAKIGTTVFYSPDILKENQLQRNKVLTTVNLYAAYYSNII